MIFSELANRIETEIEITDIYYSEGVFAVKNEEKENLINICNI